MIRFPQNRLFLVTLAAFLIFAAFFAGAFVFLHFDYTGHDHDHLSGDCLACLQLETAQNLCRGLVPAAAFSSWLEGRARTPEGFSVFSGLFSPDPVSLKVRVNS
jgi:hypothetical protein